MDLRFLLIVYISSLIYATSSPVAWSQVLHLKGGPIDPLAMPSLRAGPPSTGHHLFIVQFAEGATRTQITSFRRDFSPEARYLPDRAYMARLPASAAARLRAMDHVRWVGTVVPSWKLDPAVLSELAAKRLSDRHFALVALGLRWKSTLITKLKSHGIPIINEQRGSTIIEVEMGATELITVVAWPEVIWVDRSLGIEYDMNHARQQGGAAFLEEVAPTPDGFTGIGIRGHVFEGVNRNHHDLQSSAYRQRPIPILRGSTSRHGHQTFGIIFGDGRRDRSARGLLPNAQGYYTHSLAASSTSRYQITKDAIDRHRIMFQTASWGGTLTPSYTSRSALMDEIIFNLDIPITQSQSNSGNRDSRPEAWAKNVISVGGVYHGNNSDPADDRWNHGASIGPSSDGRIKPDLCAYYDSIYTTSAFGGYSQFGGTSGATPIVAGHVGLAIEMWTEGIFGNTLRDPAGDRFANRPHFTTVKALLVNSARAYAFSGRDHDLTRVHQGWGFPDLKGLYEMRQDILVIDESQVLREGEEFVLTGTMREHDLEHDLGRVGENSRGLRVTLVFADPPGNPASSIAVVNNLDLEVVSPGGHRYFGNHGLWEGNDSQPEGTPDLRNTVENVFLQDPASGTWQIIVKAVEVNQDGHLETTTDDVDFALVVSGLVF